MAAVDRLDELEEFLIGLRPDEVFRPNRLWQLPLIGLHEYTLPATIDRKVGDLVALSEELAHADRELVVFASDVTQTERASENDFELAYSSRETPPDVMAQAILASAAISTLVLPLRVGDRIATDGAWTRNFPLAHAYARPDVKMIAAFRYLPEYPRFDVRALTTLKRRLRPFGRVPPVRALIAELEEAESRDRRGEPAHYIDMITRLMRLSVLRGTALEERQADATDQSIHEFERLARELPAARPRPRRLRGAGAGDRAAGARLRVPVPARARAAADHRAGGGGRRRARVPHPTRSRVDRSGEARADPARLRAHGRRARSSRDRKRSTRSTLASSFPSRASGTSAAIARRACALLVKSRRSAPASIA